MNVDVTTEIVIQRARAEVYTFAVHPDNAPRWYKNIHSVEWKTTPPLACGTQIAIAARFLGRRLEYTYEVREVVPDCTFAMRTSEGPFPMNTEYQFFDAGPGMTRMTLRNWGSPSGFGKLMSPLMELAMRRANRSDLARLKDLLER